MLSFRPDKMWRTDPSQGLNVLTRMTDALESVQSEILKTYYQKTIPSLELATSLTLSDIELIAVDLETTGLNPEVDDILSIGTVRMRIDKILYGPRKRWLLKPASKLRADSIRIHGITHSDVESAPDLAEVLPEFLDELAGKVVVVHCAAIEESFLDVAIRYRFGEGFHFPAIDTMGLARSLQDQKRQSLLSRLFDNNAKPSLRLADLRKRYGLPFYPPHEAVTDALATGELLMAMHQHHNLKSETISNLLPCR